MTIMSSGGLQFGILEIISSFGNVWADQSYWQASLQAFPVGSYTADKMGAS